MVRTAFHIILLFAVLFSATGITVSRHFCMNELKSFSLVGESRGCHASEHKGCVLGGHCEKSDTEEKSNCCKDKAEYFKLEQDKQTPVSGLEPVVAPDILIALTSPFQAVFLSSFKLSLTYLLFKPPIACRDVQSLLQVFRL